MLSHAVDNGDLVKVLIIAATVLALGIVSIKIIDGLPRRYGITRATTWRTRTPRNIVVAIMIALTAMGLVVPVLRGESSTTEALEFALSHTIIATMAISAAAIDFEHMILPNELTLGAAILCVLSSPLWWTSGPGLGPLTFFSGTLSPALAAVASSLLGAAAGFALTYLPHVLYQRLRRQAGMGFGDTKLMVMAGSWLGAEGAFIVLLLGAISAAVVAIVLRALRVEIPVPESVREEIAELRRRAAAGDETASSELADDPMAREDDDGVLTARLPLGPFLVLACLELLLFRRPLMGALTSLLF